MTDPDEVACLRAVARARFGLHLEESAPDVLALIVRDRMRESGCDCLATYEKRLASPLTGPDELRALARKVTVGETYFFRNADQLRAFAEVVLPERVRARASSRVLRFLSAGCASGEEAYTLAILVREQGPRDLAAWDVKITGIDINVELLEKARRGHYTSWSLRRSPGGQLSRYLAPHGKEFDVDEGIRAMVSFEERNLLEDDRAFWKPGSFDAIFFRNVSIYLSPEAKSAAIARLARSLTPGGFIFLGDAESLPAASERLHLCNTHGAFYHRLEEGDELAPGRSWIDAIQAATDRIAWLDRPTPAPPTPSPGPELSPEEHGDRLLRAAILTNRGDVAEAARQCDALLARDERDAGAHYLKALCCEHRGDHFAAAHHDRAAADLDPTFAMPHLHLGILARRAGDPSGTRTSLERARELLGREDPARLALFGGGFNREALALLCDAEIRACEGAS